MLGLISVVHRVNKVDTENKKYLISYAGCLTQERHLIVVGA